MNILNLDYEIIEQKYNKETLVEDMLKHIELCGRNCYKSEDKITEKSYEKFVERLIKSGHNAMLEHGTIYLTIVVGSPMMDPDYMLKTSIVDFFSKNKFSYVIKEEISHPVEIEINGFKTYAQPSGDFYYITTNYRVIIENKDKMFITSCLSEYKTEKKSLLELYKQYICVPSKKHMLRHSIMFTYQIAVARDVNRHRVQSVAEESTRYCNYTKDKHGSGINVIPPLRITDEQVSELNSLFNKQSTEEILTSLCKDYISGNSENWTDIDWWLFSNITADVTYNVLKNKFSWTNQDCSYVLPLGTKTCSIHTAFDCDWELFFDLRALGKTGAPRPSLKYLACKLLFKFEELGLVKDYFEKNYKEIKSLEICK